MATDEDTQFRLVTGVTVPLSDQLSGQFDVQNRWREEGDLLELRGAIDYKANDWLTLTGALVYTEQDPADDIRLQSQAVMTFGPISLRSRVEARWYDNGDRPLIRLRQRVQFTQPLGPKTKAYVSGELLYIARTATRGQDARIDAARYEAMVLHRLSPALEVGAGYRLIQTPRKGRTDRISHSPSVTLNWKL